MEFINLYQPPPKRRFDPLSLQGLAVIGILLAISLGVIQGYMALRQEELRRQKVIVDGEMNRRTADLDKLTAVLPKRELDKALENRIKRLTLELDVKPRILAAATGGALGSSEGFSPLIEGLARRRPPQLWLSGFRFFEGGRQVIIAGQALDPALLPRYLAALADEPAFRGKEFRLFHMESADQDKKGREGSPEGDRKVTRFSLSTRVVEGARR